MNQLAQDIYREQIFYCSCLESSPQPVGSKPKTYFPPRSANNQSQSQLHLLKQQLIHIALERAPEAGLYRQICGAANQAAELAWNTPCPLLVFPCLFEELVQYASEHFQQKQTRYGIEPPCAQPADAKIGPNTRQPAQAMSTPWETGR